MHPSADLIGGKFLSLYGKGTESVLDVGSLDLNGSLKHHVPVGCSYVGVDMSAGPNVDIVLEDPHVFPFPDRRFGLVISTSCFEHDSAFWLTFKEMARVCRDDGFIYISAPTNGPVHRHPLDCWRFYPDAGLVLAKWGSVTLVDSFVHPPVGDVWVDFVAVFGKTNGWAVEPPRLSSHFPQAQHILP